MNVQLGFVSLISQSTRRYINDKTSAATTTCGTLPRSHCYHKIRNEQVNKRMNERSTVQLWLRAIPYSQQTQDTYFDRAWHTCFPAHTPTESPIADDYTSEPQHTTCCSQPQGHTAVLMIRCVLRNTTWCILIKLQQLRSLDHKSAWAVNKTPQTAVNLSRLK